MLKREKICILIIIVIYYKGDAVSSWSNRQRNEYLIDVSNANSNSN